MLIPAGLGQLDVDLVDAGVRPEAVPQAVEVVEAASLAGRARDDEAAPLKVAEPFHLATVAIEAAANVPVGDQPVTTQRAPLGLGQIRKGILDGAHERRPGVAASWNSIHVGDAFGLGRLSLRCTVQHPQPQPIEQSKNMPLGRLGSTLGMGAVERVDNVRQPLGGTHPMAGLVHVADERVGPALAPAWLFAEKVTSPR